MSKVDEYTGNGMIVVSDGEVWAVDDSGLPDVIGEIGRVELSIEMPENLIGIYRVEHIMLFDEDDEELYDDQTLVDNTEYHSERALVKAVAKKYGISEDIITVLERIIYNHKNSTHCWVLFLYVKIKEE